MVDTEAPEYRAVKTTFIDGTGRGNVKGGVVVGVGLDFRHSGDTVDFDVIVLPTSVGP